MAIINLNYPKSI